MIRIRYALLAWIAVAFLVLQACASLDISKDEASSNPASQLAKVSMDPWETIQMQGEPTARHEAALVALDKKIYLIGGRRLNPVDVLDTETMTWTQKAQTPIEIHHFQAVAVEDKIYIIGAMTGQWPNETPLEQVLIYSPETDTYKFGAEIPAERRRGGAGAVYKDGKVYVIGGITNGHMDGYVNWFDVYDVETEEWTKLPDAPHRRDHFQAAISGNKLYAFAGRRSEQRANLGFEQTVIPGNVFDFATGQWEESTQTTNIPTPRAGNMMIAHQGKIIVGGGESGLQKESHNEVEVFDSESATWSAWPDLKQGRHGSGFVIIDDYLYTVSGSGNRGGGPELTSIERLKLPGASPKPLLEASLGEKTFSKDEVEGPQLWHTLTLDFEGPTTSETDEKNPFTDYRLLVEFSNGETTYLIRGFYAADGDAAQTSATSGNIWRVRFTPDIVGEWQYKATLKTGDKIAISRDPSVGRNIDIQKATGTFTVVQSTATGKDFRAPLRGRLRADGKLFRFEKSGQYWLKGGPNSPENLLGYTGFDDTYRLLKESREGEASAAGEIHSFEPHRQDWKKGDPLWGLKTGTPRGHAIIGAMNYIEQQDMNVVYFLTNNIKGDGNDVWPYASPDQFDRFDVSKLAQWNILFDHMQAKGILLHMVTQETENELMLDGGETQFERQLYYSELISRFGHHPALIWNLGEENGPAHWLNYGQNDQQRKDMAKFFAENDPYNHTVVLHSHATPGDIEKIFTPLLGYAPLDGMSLQYHNGEDVFDVTREWAKKSEDAGKTWVISMDEIGPWFNGVQPDSIDADHDEARRHVLWGHLLAGGAGVEWYFGSKFSSNDISAEDWRTRHNLWAQTKHALTFFESYLPYWEMGECGGNTMAREDVYCLGKEGEIYAFYMPGRGSSYVTLPANGTGYTVAWYDPKAGGALQSGTIATLKGGAYEFIGLAPNTTTQDWVILLRQK